MATIPGTNGNDNLIGTAGDDLIQGLNGNDTLSGLGGNDRLEGGRGDDTLTGGTGNDVFNFEQLQDDDVVTDFVQGQDRIDVRNLNISDWATLQLLISNDGQDNALITTFFNGVQSQIKLNNINPNQLQASDFIFNTDNINQTIDGDDFFGDQLFGGLGNDTLRGFRGDDVLFGEQGNDRFEGGRGDDTFYGGAGNDVFNFAYSQDDDVVIDFVQGQDKIDVRSLNINDWATLQLLISNDGQDNALITTFFNGIQSQIKLNNINPNQLQASDFIFNTDNINQTIDGDDFFGDQLFGGLGNDTLRGFRGDDVLFGEQGNDRFEGGRGDDTFYGGAGNDVFNFAYSQDDDVVIDFVQGQDKIDVRSLNINDWATLQLLISNDGQDNALITTFFNGIQSQIKLNNINPNQLQASDFIFNTDNINQTIDGDDFFGDQLFGGLGNDTLRGFRGDDVLFGEQGNDRFEGGRGDDTFYGGAGNDVFNFAYSQDDDVVIDFVQGQDKIDVRNLNISDWATLQLLISDDGQNNALITTFFNGIQSQLKLNNINSNQLQASDFIFNTNTVNSNETINGDDFFSDQLFGGLGNDTLKGFRGNDVLFGEQGDDRFEGGRGNDTFYGGTGNDVAVYLGTRSQYQVTSSGGVFTVTDTVANRDDVDTLREIEQIQFSDQTITIANTSPTITLAVSPASVTEDGTPNLVYTFTRTGSTTNALTVNYNVAGTATLNTDYSQTGAASFTATTGTITFAAGASTAALTINPTADTTVESNETVALTLASGTGYTVGTTTAVTGTITNDDFPLISLAVSPASVTEDGTPNLIYTFTRTGSTTNALTVNYGVAGTATLNTDYSQTGAASFTATTGTISFAAGASTATLTINPTADTIVESNETVALTLASGTGYTVSTTTAVTGTITNDDSSSLTLNLSAGQTIVEGNTNPQNATYTVTLSGASTQTVTVQYATANGTATAGSDYTSRTGTLTFNPGVTSQVINIPILNDSINEPNETFTLTLTSPTNASLGTTSTVTTTITDTLTAAITTTLPANVENLTLTGTAAINGTGNAGNNILKGNSANNTLSGGVGNDTYSFPAITPLGTDTIAETATGGIDTIDFSGTTSSVRVNLGVTTSQTVNSNLKLILSANNVIENATGGTGNDRLTGNALNNILSGGDGNDQLQGLAGDDTLWGGLGDDILTGGTGNDKYLFQSGSVFSSSLGVDYISNFAVGQDKIVLSKTTFNAVTNTVGQALTDFAVVTDDQFVNGSSARIVFSQSSGGLFYNRDGNVLGTGSVFEFANLGNPDITLSGSDFTLVA